MLDKNISIYTIPAAWVIPFLSHWYVTHKAGSKYTPKDPRMLVANLAADKSLDDLTKRKILRAEAAHKNGFENLGLYAGAVLVANNASLSIPTLNWLCLGYISIRALYTVIYINNETIALAAGRTLMYLGSMGMIFTLYFKSANKIYFQS